MLVSASSAVAVVLGASGGIGSALVRFVLSIRRGFKLIEFEKGKAGIVVSSVAKLFPWSGSNPAF